MKNLNKIFLSCNYFYCKIKGKSFPTFILLICICLIYLSNNLNAQVPCDIDFDPGMPGITTAADAGANITDVDMNTNYFNVSPYSPPGSTGGAASLTINDGTEFCDENGTAMATGSEEGPDLAIIIPVPPENRLSCADGILTISLRGDFNNGCEVAFIANSAGNIISQSTTTGVEVCAGPPTRLDVIIPGCELKAEAADGEINFEIRTNGGTASTQISEVDDTCTDPASAVDLTGDGNPDGNCITFESFVWPTDNTDPFTLACPPDADPIQGCTTDDITAGNSDFPYSIAETDITGSPNNLTITGCTPASITYADSAPVEVDCSYNFTVTRTYSVTDPCGEVMSCTQLITVYDPTPPSITCPADEIVECLENIASGTPTVTVSCGSDDNITISEPMLATGDENCDGATYEIVYTITDECNREDSCTQIFTLANAGPTITCPNDETVECFENIAAGIPITTVSCGLGETITISDPALATGEENCDGATYEIVYTITDECNREDSCTQIFTLANAGPTITCPVDETVECFENIAAGTPSTTVSCGLGETITISDPTLATGEENCDGATYEIVYTVTDECNREDSCTQTFTLANDEPTITCPDDCPVACASDIVPGTPVFTVSCGLDNLSVSDPVIDGDPMCDGTTYTYTYTVTDVCGRTATCDQVFTIVNDCKFVDFDFDDDGNQLHPGTIIKYQYDDFKVSTKYSHYRSYPMLFDTGNPTSHDFDLGTPNQNYGGPGIGSGGQNNTTFQGNALIVSKDKHVPNETEGKLIFNFYCSVTIKTVDLLDMKCSESEVELYDEHHNLINYLDIPAYGVNSFNTFDVFTSGVYTMIIDLDCGGGVTGFKYCKDGSPGTLCDNAPNPEFCYDYTIDHGDCGVGWNDNATYGTIELGNELVTIKINDDEDHILEDTEVDGASLQVGIDPHNVHDQLEICYNLSKASSNIVFDITDLDYKKGKYGGSKQQEAVCIYGLLGSDPEQILPDIISLDGSVDIEDNCAEGTTNSAEGDDESILVEFTDCIDKIVIEYGTGSSSPTQHPTYSKITIGESVFTIEQCKASCDCLDSDEDGVCDDDDICEGGNDNDDLDGDGIPNFCDDDCDNSIGNGDDDADGICNNEDACPGFDDSIDENNNNVPDGCDQLKLGVDFDLSIYPNPAKTGSIIAISVTGAYQNADLLIFDELGRLLEQSKLNLSDGTNVHQLSPNLLNTGIYFVKIRTNAFNSKVHKLVIMD